MFFIPLLIVRIYVRTYILRCIVHTYVRTYIMSSYVLYVHMFNASMCLSIIGNIIIVRLSVSGNSHFNS